MRVYSASLSPMINDKGEEEYVIEARLDSFKKFVDDLVKVIYGQRLLRNIITTILKSHPNDEGVAKVLRLINDLIVMYFKRVFITPLTPPKHGNPPQEGDLGIYVMAPQDLLYAYVIARDIDLVNEEAIREILDKPLVETSFEALSELTGSIAGVLGEAVFDKLFAVKPPEEVYKDFIDIVMSVPADTRPGLNISKLIPHLLTTSAIAATKYLSTVPRQERQNLKPERMLGLEMLRMASLLHDIGKPEAWSSGVSHADVSARIVSRVLKVLQEVIMNDPELRGNNDLIVKVNVVTEGIVALVKHHHRPDAVARDVTVGDSTISLRSLLDLLRAGDKASSATDRVVELVCDVLSKSEIIKSRNVSKEELLIALRESGLRAREFWGRFSDEEMRTLSYEVAVEIGRLARTRWNFGSITNIGGVKVVGIDIRGIQSFIRRESLRALAAASALIDVLTMYALPRVLVECLGIPLEALVFTGGGTLIAFIPSIEEDEVKGILSSVSDRLGFNVGISFATADLSVPWVATQRALFSRLNASKVTLRRIDCSVRDVVFGYEVGCELCRRRPATQVDPMLGCVCDECWKLHEFGKSMYVLYKLKLLKRFGYNTSTYISNAEDVFQHLMEWLSGARNYTEKGRYLAVVKIDGNSIGSYMAYAVTPAEAYLRSARVELGVKMGIHSLMKLLSDLDRGVNPNRFELLDGITYEDAVVRLFTGILYAGGDDLLALVPSTLALPLVISVSYWFWRLTGGRTLSAGIACGKPKHNVWILIDTANALLKKSKEKFRELASSGRCADALLYVYFELGTQQLLPSVVDSVSTLYGGKEGLFREPYVLGSKAYVENSLETLIKVMGINVGSCRKYAEVSDLLRKLLSDESLPMSELRKARSALAELLMSVLTHALTRKHVSDLWPAMATKLASLACEKPSYVQRMYRELASTMLTDFQHTKKHLLPPLRDLLVLINMIIGGG